MNSLGSLLFSLLPFIITILLTRIDNIGTSGLFINLFYLSAQLGLISIFGGRVNQISDINSLINLEEFVLSRILTSIIMLIVGIVFSILSNYSSYVSTIFYLLLCYRIIESFSDLIYGEFQKNEKLYISGIFMSLKSVLNFFSFGIVFYFSKNLVLSTLVLFISSLTLLIFEILTLKHKFRFRAIFSVKICSLLAKQFPVFIIIFLFFIQMNFPRYLLSLSSSNETIGLFNVIALPSSFTILISVLIFQPKLIYLNSLIKNAHFNEYKKQIYIIISKISIISILYTLSLKFVFIRILSLFYNVDLSSYSTYILLVSFLSCFGGMFYFLNYQLSTFNEFKSQLLILISVSILSILVTSFVIGDFGILETSLLYSVPITLITISMLIRLMVVISQIEQM